MWQHTQLTGTNSRTLDRIDPLLGSVFLTPWPDGESAHLCYGEPDLVRLAVAQEIRLVAIRAHVERLLPLPIDINDFRLAIFDCRLKDIVWQSKIENHQSEIMRLLGEHTRMVTPVPIPNTAVKHPGPMVVATAARVGYCRDY